MKKILSMLNYENLKQISIRFPFLIKIILITSILSILHIWGFFDYQMNNLITKIIFTLVIVFFFWLWNYLLTESFKLNYIKRNLFQLISVLFWILFFIFFNSENWYLIEIVFFFTSLLWIISFVFIAPYVNRKIIENKQEKFFSYFYNMSVILLTSAIFWLVLFLLWAIWLSAIFALFDLINIISYNFYWYWAVISFILVSPLFALHKIPKENEFYLEEIEQNKFTTFLVKFIAIPFIYVYFIILYLYAIKVLENFWDWPKWEVSWLVIAFSTFWYLIYIFSYPFSESNKLISLFRKYFPFVVTPQIFMLFYAIYLRINQYDITINRYLVVVFWIWLLVISLYLIFSKKKFLWAIPLVLTIFTIIISIWPWSVYSLPEHRQLKLLKNNLEQVWVLVNWNVILPENYIEAEKWKEIYSQISYICNNHKCNNVEKIFSDLINEFKIEHKERFEKNKIEEIERIENNLNSEEKEERIEVVKNRKYNWPSNWETINFITEKIKVKSYYNDFVSKFININTIWDELFPIDVKWFDKIVKIYSDENDLNNIKSTRNISEEKDHIKINPETNNLKLVINKEVIEKDIKNIIDEIYELYLKNNNQELDSKDLIFDIQLEKYEVKLIINHISILNPEYEWSNNYNYTYIDGYWLIMEKSFD